MRWVGRELPGMKEKPLHPTAMLRSVPPVDVSGVSELPRAREFASDPLAPLREWPRPEAHIDMAVIGRPAPQGSKRPGKRAKDGHIPLIESSKYLGTWRDTVKDEFKRYAGWSDESRTFEGDWPLYGPLVVEMIFTLSKPASASKKVRTWPATKGNDISKFARGVEDALKDVGAIEDDGMIIEYVRLCKVFPNDDRDSLPTPGCVIRVWSVSRFLSESESGVH